MMTNGLTYVMSFVRWRKEEEFDGDGESLKAGGEPAKLP